jgi:tellurite resistance protein TehA-like permease
VNSKESRRLLALGVGLLGNVLFFSACAVIEIAIGIPPLWVALVTAVFVALTIVWLLRR